MLLQNRGTARFGIGSSHETLVRYTRLARSELIICGAASTARSWICSGVRLPIGCWISANG